MNVAEPLRQAAARTPEAPALLADGATTTFAELDRAVDRAAAGYQRLGLEPGERVLLLLGNVPAMPVAVLGAMRAGLVAVPGPGSATAHELAHLLTDADTRTVVCAPASTELVADAVLQGAAVDQVVVAGAPGSAAGHAGASGPELRDAASGQRATQGIRPDPGAAPRSASAVGHWEQLAWDATLGADGEPAAVDLAPDALALLAYTSGSAGRPRGVMLSHGALLANQEQMGATRLQIGAGDVVLCVLPLFHLYALNVALLHPLACGAAVLLEDRFDPRATLEAAVRARATVLIGAPTMFQAWLADGVADELDLGALRMAVSGAAALPPALQRAFSERFGVPLWEGYGLTETGPLLATNAMGERPVPGSVGRPVPGVELRLLDEHGKEVAEGDPGELVVRGPNLFSGYWRDEAGTAAVRDGDGWFATGDIAYREGGLLYLVDRKSDLVIVNGFNVYPREVEEALLRHPAVAEAAAIGVPDARTGEALRAWVVLRPGAEATSEELTAHSRRWLARYKCPAQVEVTATLPRLPSGKVKRRDLR